MRLESWGDALLRATLVLGQRLLYVALELLALRLAQARLELAEFQRLAVRGESLLFAERASPGGT